jgi:phytoene dehydrogenase-like protein
MSYDAVIIGAGHNGIVAGIYLAKAGWKVLVLERNEQPGGAVRTAEATLPGFRHDLFATNLNLFAGSPFYNEFRGDLHKHGLEFVNNPNAFSSAYPGGGWLGVSADLDATLDGIRKYSPRDAESWSGLLEMFKRNAPYLFPLLGSAMPSWNLASGILSGVRARGLDWLRDTAQLVVSSPRDFLDANFESEEVKSLVAPWGMHLDFPPDAAGGALICYLETMADQLNGMVIGRGGCGNLIDSLTGLFKSLGGELRCGAEAAGVEVSSGRASGVKLAGGEIIQANKAVIANTAPTVLFGKLLGSEVLPGRFNDRVGNYRYGPGAMMIHAALSDLPGWTGGEGLKKYMYVHLAPYLVDMARTYVEAMSGLLPSSPVLVVGQPTAVDPSRAPEGRHVLWIMVRSLPAEVKGDALREIEGRDWDEIKEAYADRVIDKLAEYAPDIKGKILARTVLSPKDLERSNPNLVGGDSVCGSHHLYQNYFMRPFPGWSRYKTPIKNLYMVGAATWPGAGTGAGSGRLLGKMLTGG